MKSDKYLHCICKEECGSILTTFYKNLKYKYEQINSSYSIFNIKVYNEFDIYVLFIENDFKKYFFTEKELRKEKLKKLKNYE